MTIGIDINEVLRDYIGKLMSVYEKYCDTKPVLPVDSFELEKHFPFEGGIDEFNEFVYGEAAYEICASANEIDGQMVHLNEFDLSLKKDGEHKVKLVSREALKSVPATYFFLAKTGCNIMDVNFYTKYENLWDDVDVLITANPRVLANKPSDKISVMINTAYNENSDADYNISCLKDFILDKTLQDKVLGTKTTNYEEI